MKLRELIKNAFLSEGCGEWSVKVTLDGRQQGAEQSKAGAGVGMALPDSKGVFPLIDIQSQAPRDVTWVQYCAEVPP